MLVLALDIVPLTVLSILSKPGSTVSCDAQSHHSHLAGAFGETSTCFSLKQGWGQQMPDLQEIVPGLETKAEEKPAHNQAEELFELKAPAEH